MKSDVLLGGNTQHSQNYWSKDWVISPVSHVSGERACVPIRTLKGCPECLLLGPCSYCRARGLSCSVRTDNSTGIVANYSTAWLTLLGLGLVKPPTFTSTRTSSLEANSNASGGAEREAEGSFSLCKRSIEIRKGNIRIFSLCILGAKL